MLIPMKVFRCNKSCALTVVFLSLCMLQAQADLKTFKVYLKPYLLLENSYVCIPRFLAEPLIMFYGTLRIRGSLVVKYWRTSQLYKTDHSRTYIQAI
jgi:hypothetical protein